MGGLQLLYVLMLACLWAAVGALVIFVRADVTLPQRVGLTIVTSLVFGVVGWMDVSSIVHSVHSHPAVIAKDLVRPDIDPRR
jgi:hypothetical protein